MTSQGGEQTRQLVVTVHGIRTFGNWQERLEDVTRQASQAENVVFCHYKYGYFSILAFLVPPLRWLVVRAFRNELRAIVAGGRYSRIDLVGHSFGTHIIGWALLGLKPHDNISIHTVILSGSVLRSSFQWSRLIGSRVRRLINDCGTADNVLLLSQFFVLFTGMAGRTGFVGMTNDHFRNRFSMFGHSGYFQDDEGNPSNRYMERNWLELLTGDKPVRLFAELPQGGAVSGVILMMANNAEPVKLSVYLSIPFAIAGTMLVLYLNAETERVEAERLKDVAVAQAQQARRSESTAFKLAARQSLDANAPQQAVQLALQGLPLRLDKPERPLLEDLVDELDAGLSDINPKYLIPRRASVIAVDPGGIHLAVGLPDTIEIWELATGKRAGVIPASKAGVAYLEFSADGQLLMSQDRGGDPKVWRISELRQLSSFELGGREVFGSPHLSPDGRLGITAIADGSVLLWDTSSGQLLKKWQAHRVDPANLPGKTAISSTAASRDAGYFATGGADGKINIWSLRDPEHYRTIEAHANWVIALALTPDGRTLVSSGDDRLAKAWSTESGQLIGQPLKHGAQPLWLSISPDGRTAAVSDGSIHVWNLQTGKELGTVSAQLGWVTQLTFSEDSSRLISGAEGDTALRVWRIQDQALESIMRFGDRPASEIRTTANDLLVSRSDISIAVWDLRRDEMIRWPAATAPEEEQGQAASSPESGLIASRSTNRPIVSVRNLNRTDQVPIQLIGHRGQINSIRFDRSGKRILTAASDGMAVLWDAGSGKPIQVFPSRRVVEGAEFLDDRFIVTFPRGPKAYIWETGTAANPIALDGKDTYETLTPSDDGTLLTGVNEDGQLVLWRLDHPAEPRTLRNPAGANAGVSARTFTSDGSTLLVGFESGLTIAYDVATGLERKRLAKHTTKIVNINISKDGTRFATTSNDGLVIAWRLRDFSIVSTISTDLGGIWGTDLDDHGDRALSYSADKILLWRPDSGIVVRKFANNGVRPIEANPNWDRHRLFVFNADASVRELNLLAASDVVAGPSPSPASRRQALVDFGRVMTPLVLPPGVTDQRIAAKPADRCDVLAAQPYDPNKQAIGAASDQMETGPAEEACRAAIKKSRNEPRFHYQHGRTLQNLGLYKAALADFKTAIKLGYPMAYVGRFSLYESGHDADLSLPQAIELLTKALDLGVGIAGSMLADRYWTGAGVPVDKVRALDLYQRAAAFGIPNAHRKLSELYEDGVLVPHDIERALYHQILAAYEAERRGLGNPADALRRASLARLLAPADVARLWSMATRGTSAEQPAGPPLASQEGVSRGAEDFTAARRQR
ncbi:SEL1-like repeat protein [Bradyrhizobium diazoefficiens]|nr:SEL1-like repeat protein [Bradyrhizobium diazoefficiens]MBR0848307.1 SEL1-like repeat protein [Bradyrhizobium diazoefficiens]